MRDYAPHYENSYALVVGIDAYRHENLAPLSTAIHGAKAVARVLEDRYDFRVVELYDRDATYQKVRDVADWLHTHTDLNDRVVVYFAGHGVGRRLANGTVRGDLALYDTDPVHGLRFMPMYHLLDTVQILAKHALLILDACYSGLALNIPETRALSPVVSPEHAVEYFLQERAYHVLASAQPEEVATDAGIPELEGHTPFTGFLLRALRGEDLGAYRPETRLLTAESVAAYVRDSVTGYHGWQGPKYGPLPRSGGGDLLWMIPQQDDDSFPPGLRPLLEHDDPAIRRMAVREAADHLDDPRYGEAVLSILRSMAVSDLDESVRERCLDMLLQYGRKVPITSRLPDIPIRTQWTQHTALEVERLSTGEDGAALAICWSRDGLLLAGGHHLGTVQVWRMRDPEEHEVVLNYTIHQNHILGLAWSRSSRRLVSSSRDGSIRMVNVLSQEESSTPLLSDEAPVRAVAWSPDGESLAAADEDGTIRLWEMRHHETPIEFAMLSGHNAAVNAVAWSPDSNTLASASDDHRVALWNANTAQPLAWLHGRNGTALDVAWQPYGNLLASAHRSGSIILWDTDRYSQWAILSQRTVPSVGLAWSPEGTRLAVAHADGRVVIWDASAKTVLIQLWEVPNVYGLSWSPDGRVLAAASSDIVLWRAVT